MIKKIGTSVDRMKYILKLCGYLGSVLLVVVLMTSCKSDTKSIQREAIRLSHSTSVAELIELAREVAITGAGSCSFVFSDSTEITLQFPLLDGDKKHWQFKVITEVDAQRKDLGMQKTSDAFVICAVCSESGWSLGGVPISEAEIEQEIRKYSKLYARTVLIIRSDDKLPAQRLKRVWQSAQSAQVRVVIM